MALLSEGESRFDRVFAVAQGSDAVNVLGVGTSSNGQLTFLTDVSSAVSGLTDPSGVALSPNGAQVYVVGRTSNNIVTFTVDVNDGLLDFLEARGSLDAPIGLVIAPDGGHVFVADSAGLKVFGRDTTSGTLTYQSGVSSLVAMSPVAMVMDPSGTDFYVIDGATHNLLHFRDLEVPFLILLEATYLGATFSKLVGASALALSPEGDRLFVSGGARENGYFDRDPSTGALTIAADLPDSQYIFSTEGATSLAVANDADYVRSMYVGSSNGLGIFTAGCGCAPGYYGSEVLSELQNNDVEDLAGPYFIAISPDGKNVYVPSTSANQLVSFNRAVEGDAYGELAFAESVNMVNVGVPNSLVSPTSAVVSPNGAYVYVTSRPLDPTDRSIVGDLTYFTRDDTGLTFLGRITAADLLAPTCAWDGAVSSFVDDVGIVCEEPLNGPYSVTTNGDGSAIFVASTSFQKRNYGSLAWFTRDTSTGMLSHAGTVFHDTTNNGQTVELSGAYTVIVVGAHVYVASDTSKAVSMFEWSITDGLTCLGVAQSPYVDPEDPEQLICEGPRSLAMSPDGRHMYVACGYSDTVAIFDRNPTNGLLTYLDAVRQNDVNNGQTVVSLDFPLSVAVSTTGDHVYVASQVNKLDLFGHVNCFNHLKKTLFNSF
jgi:6-phosphogluconolactonase (cycloisomerase 2 family)